MQLTARAQRSGTWWAVEVDEIPGLFTQARRLEQGAGMVEDAASLLGLIGPFEVEVVPALADGLTNEIAAARALADEARAVQARAAASSRHLVQRLRSEGLSVRDVAIVLKISPQRVSQLMQQPGAESAVA